ncbi:MAG: pantoate--beta-alanine ligase [Acidobacteria bacterium]|nr:pantoate--beta-alanine ligase [Acidobacteriota bacterium]
MEIINRRQRMFSIARKLRREGKTVSFVPTMGALHAGHVELVKQARKRAEVIVVSIFVNPTQFGQGEDFEKYPRDLMADTALLADHNVDYVFAPEADEIYPDGFSTYVYVENLTDSFEGASRPGHFRGVTTIVAILLNTVRPDFAVLGQKDAQQVAVIRRMTRDLGFELEIVVVPTVREDSGLALSQIVQDTIETEPEAIIDYITVADWASLQPVDKVEDKESIVAAAVRFGGVRLIDNVLLNPGQ